MIPAPFDTALADAPAGTQAWWVHADDGVRLRLAHVPADDPRGTVLLLPGRTEYCEKYGRTARDLAERGFATLVIDWRGQGRADRLLPDARIGHVERFSDYQRDMAAMLKTAERLDLPRPWHILAHSMGGCIGLRALLNGAPVASAVFSAPMWGIRIAPAMRQIAWTLSWSGTRAGLGHLLVPGSKLESYVATEPFETNTLTRDRDMWNYIQAQTLSDPAFQLGGPSLRWLKEALSETLALSRMPSPALPCLTFLGTAEKIVDPARIHERMARWPGGRLELIENGEHEMLMENRGLRTRLADRMVDHFQAALDRNGRAALSA